MIKNRSFKFSVLGVCLILIVVSAALSAPTVSYLLAMPKPSSHLFEVTLRIEGLKTPRVEVAMPAWSPGAYAMGNYARNVQEFSATDGTGKALPFEKTDKQTWRIAPGGDAIVIVKYKYYAGPSAGPRGMGFSMTQLDTSHASVTGPNLFMYVVGKSPYPLEAPVRLTIEAPAG
jgi:predicted metalloprotease with PDZ domain